MNKIDPAESSCPMGCKYCVINKVESRRALWEKSTIIGLNKAVTILNPPFDLNDKKAVDEFYGFPIHLLEADYVGFNATSDPLWPKYHEELMWFLKTVAPVAKLISLVTKFPMTARMAQILAEINNLEITVSITGLDTLEKGSTQERLETLRRAKEYGIKAFPIIHPYISGLSDLSFLKQLKEMGYDEVDVKGLRYNHENMRDWMPEESQKLYVDTEEKEILPEDGWREKVQEAGLTLKSVRKWQQEIAQKEPTLTREEARKRVLEIVQIANITSSDTNEEVIEASIQRRL